LKPIWNLASPACQWPRQFRQANRIVHIPQPLAAGRADGAKT
jgi:hypothetical protein